MMFAPTSTASRCGGALLLLPMLLLATPAAEAGATAAPVANATAQQDPVQSCGAAELFGNSLWRRTRAEGRTTLRPRKPGSRQQARRPHRAAPPPMAAEPAPEQEVEAVFSRAFQLCLSPAGGAVRPPRYRT